jgi:hypothetical protein
LAIFQENGDGGALYDRVMIAIGGCFRCEGFSFWEGSAGQP